jgi:hypothetical protein
MMTMFATLLFLALVGVLSLLTRGLFSLWVAAHRVREASNAGPEIQPLT